jgi:hypothetical protein
MALPGGKNIILHDCDAASKTVLIAKALKDPLRGVALLLQTLGIVFKDLVNNADKRISLGRTGAFLLRYPGGVENANILSTVRRSTPNTRAASRRLIP